ncbi:Cilia- and flagella-associated protein 52 [Desmophyllum pertusum]|uniref:Cilia- and flagella-associated protein 52 n=1 Tax=Desmophyllum pertusum TaxID=174260 RepID=A0A9W9ZYE6_9CNID|nr:Cilia- and flagella-associated protein 52 [Desmophyllum pertusum]
MSDIEPLELHAIIGFAGEVPGGLLVNSDREHLIYPLGNTIVVEEIKEDKRQLLVVDRVLEDQQRAVKAKIHQKIHGCARDYYQGTKKMPGGFLPGCFQKWKVSGFW